MIPVKQTCLHCPLAIKYWVNGKSLVRMATDAEAVFSTSCSREKMCCLKHHGNMREATANWHSLLTPNFETNYYKVVAQI